METTRPKVLVIGLDCAAPLLVFERWREILPNLAGLMERGVYGDLESTIPPITVPAWTCMMTSKDPGQHGFYGFRNRKDHSYDELYFANARYVKLPTLWNYLSRNRLTSILIGVPQTYPPKPLNGIMVSSFLAPDKSNYTYPPEVAAELDAVADGDYVIDVKKFRTDDKDWLLESIHVMTKKRFKVVREFMKTKDWDFFMFVEMGIDRIHHGFWRFFDTGHRLYEPGNKYENAIRDYYVAVDEEIGRTLELIDADTHVMVVSDHGAKSMKGGIVVNEWLQQEGYLALKEQPAEQTPLKTSMIDWSKTRAWGEGGYYGRIFMNVRGREPQGIILPENYERERDELLRKLEGICDPEGKNIGTRVFKPQEVYREVNNVPPDMIVYFGDLDWRSMGSVGVGAIHVFENDTGPDDANHDRNGIFIFNGPAVPQAVRGSRLEGVTLYDVTPTVLDLFGLDIPDGLVGKKIEFK